MLFSSETIDRSPILSTPVENEPEEKLDFDPNSTFWGTSFEIKHSVKKLVPIARQVRKLSALEALDQLEFSPKKGSTAIHLAIKTAIAAAKENNVDESNLVVNQIISQKVRTLKRRGHGRRSNMAIKRHRYSKVRAQLAIQVPDKSDPRVTKVGRFGPVFPEIRERRKQLQKEKLKQQIMNLVEQRQNDLVPTQPTN